MALSTAWCTAEALIVIMSDRPYSFFTEKPYTFFVSIDEEVLTICPKINP
jgi:hypothetical protein